MVVVVGVVVGVTAVVGGTVTSGTVVVVVVDRGGHLTVLGGWGTVVAGEQYSFPYTWSSQSGCGQVW